MFGAETTPVILEKIWILPAIMAASFLLILLIGKRFGERIRSLIGILAIGACFVLALVASAQWIQRVNAPPTGEAAAAASAACGAPGGVLLSEEVAGAAGEGHGAEASGGEGGEGHGTEAPAEGEGGASEGEHALGALPAAEEGGAHEVTVPVCSSWTWLETGTTTEPGVTIEFGFVADGLSVMMLFVVTLISLLVHIYSTEYLHDDRRHTHYYAFLSLFSAAMLFYVLSNNTLQMLMGWELVGVCSFALIGHWWEERKNSDAALKAFMTNRVGDTGLIIGVIVTFFAAGATSFNVFHLNEYALSSGANTTLLLVGSLALFWGVTSKSGQFPLHTWLPDAMAGPTPVSALIHAATMVVAGVYLIARLYAVFFSGLEINGTTIHYVALIGGITTLVGASLAFVQHDIKKVLAYSTISQLGYMVMALGVGAWTAGVFHLFTHAFFKACLFLGAGSVSHACHHTFDMREMGGLKKHMPVTRWTFLIATIALAGIFPFAGFWSKDEILAGAANGQGAGAYSIMLVMGLITALLTAAYMGRAYWLTFEGEYRGHAHPHESPKVMTIPLIILAGFAVFAGFTNFPGGPDNFAHRFEHFVQPTYLFPPIEVASFNPALAGISLLLAVSGLVGALLYYKNGAPLTGLTERNPVARAGYVLLEKKYYLDEVYDGLGLVIRGPVGRGAYWVNQKVIDAVVNAAGVATRAVGRFTYRYIDQDVVDGIVDGSGAASEGSGQFLRRLQTGKVQEYAALLFGGAVVLAIIFLITI